MPTHTFPCPFCGKKMGVGIELLGKKVRCPHCNQILVAPAPVATPVVVASPPPPPPVIVVAPPPPLPPPPVQHADLPVFNIPSQEARESIFGEQQDESDDLFSSSEGTKLQVPDLPPLEPEPAPMEVMPVPVPVVQPTKGPDPAYEPTMEMNSPFTGFEASPLPISPPPVVVQPVPVVVPIPAPPPPPIPRVAPIGATPPSSPGTNPWAGMDDVPVVQAAVPTLVPVPVPVPTLVPVPAPDAESDSPFTTTNDEPRTKKKKRDRDRDDDDRDDDRPAKPKPRAAKPDAGGGSPLIKIGFFVLLPYAFIVTVVAIYALLFKSSAPTGHPLSNLPDNFGEFGPAERKKTGKLSTITTEGDLPPELRVALGSKLEIGQLEVEPLAVEVRNLKIFTEGKNAKDVQQTPSPAIVLKMKIKNASEDLLIQPLDPAFNRKPIGNSDRVATGLVVGKQNIWGGAISWPFKPNVVRSFEAAQEGEFTALKPGESREYVVFTDASNRVVKSVREAKDPLLWRVQVRRGRMEFDGRDIPVTAIIGVEFKPSDVKDAD